MQTLNTIIKLHRTELDDLTKALVDKITEKEELTQHSNELEQELVKEHSLAIKNPELGGVFENYKKRIRTKQKSIEKNIQTIEKMMVQIQEQIFEKYGELKKYEILQERQEEEKRKQLDKQESGELDAIGLQLTAGVYN